MKLHRLTRTLAATLALATLALSVSCLLYPEPGYRRGGGGGGGGGWHGSQHWHRR